MKTCRLLCALLVLALCCCPSVCVAQDTEKVEESAKTTTTTTTTMQPPDPKTNPKAGAQANLGVTISSSSSTEGMEGKDQPSPHAPPVNKPAEKPGEDAVAGKSLTGTTGLQSDTNKSADHTDKEDEEPAKTTTTTTTKAPTTTTTTTTTEAPATTTTRAPSRLRETDGSLSSSAWVCAPLLLAACALAYTAVG
ncbi:putative mucin TcMUCII [Trypanosoma cruzi]|uniref:Mucin TcMUCII, putative n=2 Tax=Trypanosoma cruzi TaxID=5693 RepID=Q4DEZ9_TRYCC|nr:mucin TcMUCII, putative [Trypanosoma cruzi]EAN91097.1 mucin TcMUCII, putative [Trypanosoma cruzi]PWV14232.1 putative mucin TcMUCII [Trypanosoma cruzi]RNC39895.1 mucin TcMUCII [Trypanosoma cruzi]|eukprot:XP_812948.1 mucin TcMUCII [Trypanosoma cruzi strain CL Brener]